MKHLHIAFVRNPLLLSLTDGTVPAVETRGIRAKALRNRWVVVVRDSLLLILLFASVSSGAVETCNNDPERFLSLNSRAEHFYICDTKVGEEYCESPKSSQCEAVHFAETLDALNSRKNYFGPAQSVQNFAESRSIKKRVLASFLAAMNFSRRITIQPTLEIQTGKYSNVGASLEALNSRCMATIVQAAYKLHNRFPNYTFVIDSHIQNCNNLRDGVKRLIANQGLVEKNLSRIMNPLNSVFLTHQTKFVRGELGKMGLHINVDQDGEIERRLISWDVSSISNLGGVRGHRSKALQVSL